MSYHDGWAERPSEDTYPPHHRRREPHRWMPPEMVRRPMRLARAYVPMQIYARRFSPMEGLQRGTIFPELVSPYPHDRRGR